MLFKVLDAEGRSCNGGDLQWSLPTQNADGAWKPGDWMPEVTGDLVPCENGYHAAQDAQVLKWFGPRLFEIEAQPGSEAVQASDKVVMRGPVRLVREFTTWNERTARLFAVWCARQALALVDNPDPRSVAACDVAERYANSEASKDELAAAWAAAWDAARDAAWDAARDAARDAAWDAARRRQCASLDAILLAAMRHKEV
jgi:hypothetical protein